MSSSQLTWDFKALVVCTAVLYFKFLITTMIQGRKAFAAGTRAPEDKALPMAKGTPVEANFGIHGSPVPTADENLKTPSTAIATAVEDEMRWKRIIQNDLESIPIALVVFLVATFSGSNRTTNAILTIVYTAARVLHTLAYANKLAIARMLTWMCGIACIVATAVLAVIAVAK